ncbi:MAG TPA: PHP domain-containing protein [Roseiflexaceae bacterium]
MPASAELQQLTGKADLHIHTTYSDGTASVREVLAHVAARTGLRLIAITDHDAIAGALEARRLAPQFGLEAIVGQEVSTAEGHLLALFITSLLPPGRPAAETIAAAHAQGGLCIAPHPFDTAVPSLGCAGLCERYASGEWPIDAIEGLNGAVMWPRRGSNLVAQQCARDLQLPTTGGSDSHTLATIGVGYTLFDGASADDLYRAIRAGRTTWGGRCWGAFQYLDLIRRWVRQRSLRGALRLAMSGGALPLQH